MRPRLLLDIEVVEFLSTLKRREQLALRGRFLEIRDLPSDFSDYREFDETGRPIDVHVFNNFAITYWDDQADRHLKILDVKYADRR